ncbi:hypothetical protein [Streptomyces sp. NPDC001056]
MTTIRKEVGSVGTMHLARSDAIQINDARSLRGEALERRTRATQWMLRAATAPYTAEQWTERGVAVLTAGIVWDVVRAPYSVLGRGLDRRTDPEALRSLVTALGAGAVWCDPYRPAVYFLVPPGTDEYWPRDLAAVCQGGTGPYVHHIGVPSLDRTSPPGQFWLVPPDYGGPVLAGPERLHEALRERTSEPSAPASRTP